MRSKFCSLCFALCDNSYESIEDDARESLAQLLPHLLDIKTERGVQLVCCTDCSTRLSGYLEFKSSFLQAQAEQSDSLDLTQACLQNEGRGSEVSTKDLVVCRFCLKQATGAYTRLVEDQKAVAWVTIMIAKCFPGLELGSLSGHVICLTCHEALETSYNFLSELDVENCIKDEALEEMDEGQDLKTVLLDSDWFRGGCIDLKRVEKDDLCMVKGGSFDEALETKVERGLELLDQPKLEANRKVKIEPIQTDDSRNQGMYVGREGDVTIKKEDVEVEEHNLISIVDDTCDAKAVQTCKRMYKCESCPYETSSKRTLTSHELTHKNALELPMFKCKACSYATRYKQYYNQHMLTHKNPSEVPTYKCEACLYETNNKRNYTKHKFMHKSPSEITMYKCESCKYETRRKDNLRTHKLIHKNPSDITMYKCDSCPYETKYKQSLIYHERNHKDAPERTFFKCKACSYETRVKQRYSQHMQLIHNDASKVTVYKCETCTYENYDKQSFLRHVLVHKEQGFKCELCTFRTQYSRNLTRHKLVHKSPSEVQTFKCELCPYQGMKKYFNRHMSLHKGPRNFATFKCDACEYETRYKSV